MTKPSNNSNLAQRKKRQGVCNKSALKMPKNGTHAAGKNESRFGQQRSAGFYCAFEERFRGTRDTIKERLKVYLPFVTPLLELHQPAIALDLGCGRGEWLELMRDKGFEVQGVDLDEGMCQFSRERDLPVLQEEAVSYLKAMDDESYSIVSGFHIAEHLPFEALQGLVAEALRVLRRGGLLILETPNPENIVVGTTSFYLDPTHRQPLPPDLLAFLPEYHGFARTKILRLQESQALINNPDVSLFAVLSGVSPDYAVVAQKDGSEELFNVLNTAFSAEYGLTLETLSGKYQERIDVKIQQAEARAQQAENTAQQAEAKAQQAENTAQQAKARAQQAENAAQQAENAAQQAENAAQQAENAAQQAEAGLNTVLSSRSWRITKPLRLLANGMRSLRNGTKQTTKAALRPILGRTILFISARPRLKRPALAWVRKYPRLEERLRRFAGAGGGQYDALLDQPHTPPMELAHPTPRARQIYADLKAAIEKNKQDSA